MINLIPRARRIDLSFPLCFVQDKQENHGHCLNISESGLMASLEQEAELWTVGVLQLSFGASVVALRARIARCAEGQAGLSFLYDSEEQRVTIRTLIESVATRGTVAGGLPPF